jgi:enoyl-CoA hydratase/carnithine racemase
MALVRWERERALLADPRDIDELDGASVLVVDGPSDVAWLGRAPCVVAGFDVEVADDELERLVDAVERNPNAARTLVDVLRTVEHLDMERGLMVESLAYSLLLTGSEFADWLRARPARSARELGAPVHVERVGADLTITLARPEVRNAFGAAMRDALVDAIALAEVDVTIEQITLRGDGPSFSSGGDLTEFGSDADALRAHQVRTLRSAGAAITRVADRTTARVQGACVGAGVELSAFAATVIAAPGTTFRLPEVAMGLIPGAGGTVSVTKRVGRQRAARLALFGDAIDAETALGWGLIDEVRGDLHD